MPLTHIVMVLLFYGIVLWLIQIYVPSTGRVKPALNALVVIAACVWVTQALGLWSAF